MVFPLMDEPNNKTVPTFLILLTIFVLFIINLYSHSVSHAQVMAAKSNLSITSSK